MQCEGNQDNYTQMCFRPRLEELARTFQRLRKLTMQSVD